MRRQPEAEIRQGIKKFLKQLGFACYDMEQNRPTRQTPGVSDLIIFGRGRTVFAEIKTAKGKQTAHQKTFEEHVGEGQGTYVVWRSTTEVMDWLKDEKVLP